MKSENKKQLIPIVLFVVLGGLMGLGAAEWMKYRQELASQSNSREKIEALYDIALAAGAGNFGYARAQLKKIELEQPPRFLLSQAQRFVEITSAFEAAEEKAASGNWSEAIQLLEGLSIEDLWQEPLSSFKERKHQRLKQWKKQRFVLAQESFVLALERGDEEAAKKYLEILGAGPGEDVSLAPMKKQLESLLGSGLERKDDGRKALKKNAPPVRMQKRDKKYMSDATAQIKFIEALETFREGADQKACNDLKALLSRSRPNSVWWDKSKSFLKRKCER